MYRRRCRLRRRERNPRIRAVSKTLPRDQKTKYCLECGAPTQERKDFCSEHVGQHPYVISLIRKMELSDQEEADVRKYGYQAIRDDSIILNDIIVILQTRGDRTVERLAREVVRDIDLVERYVEYLYQRGLVDLHENRRGHIIVSLVDSEATSSSRRRYRRYLR